MLDTDHTAPAEGADLPPLPQPLTVRRSQAPRSRSVGAVADFLAARDGEGLTQREFARRTGVPRTTLQGWLAGVQHTGLEPEVVAFFESPAGVRFLHRLFQALLVVMTLVCASGLRHLAMVLRLSGLDRWIAPSHGALRAASVRMEACVGRIGDEQRAKLALGMPPRKIALVEDETHHPTPCLVAIEPNSNFILVEQYSATRDAKAWDAAVAHAMEGLSVEVEQVTSDLARGIRLHVRVGLRAWHNADVFHAQYDASRATGAALAVQERHAEETLSEARGELEAVRAKADAATLVPRKPGRPVEWPARIAQAEQEVEDAREVLDEAHTQREAMQRDVRQISASYHPFDLTTGAPRSSDTVRNDLQATVARMKELAEAAGLGKRREALLAKAARVVPWLVATIAWFHKRVAERVAALSLPAAVAAVMHTELIPGLYLLRVARRARVPEVRDRLHAQGLALVTKAREGLLRELPEALRRKAERVAMECAGLFVAASACVEGRNGHLRQSLNGLHRLLPGKLKALTVVHNFFLRRPDGTTAAERFFGAAHDDLFELLCARLPSPARPRPRRVRSEEPTEATG